ncbi:HtaA domain-containing protein [Streptomyces lichenis]|uniref:HtaA domain-containing protein n=1 Tax=Streptomyces lichenis TaxID=2306967 RepID=A0ABT0IAM2_9ACTN|nr:HtaA domain-containing protein [Streptomyces lichenis]MCK8678363.1 HtaA domain-containing protein [Streptomyces lichenis]
MNRKAGAAALAAGVLLALLGQPSAGARENEPRTPREVSGGYASWALAGGSLTGRGGAEVTVHADRPATAGTGERVWFPVGDGSADPAAGDAAMELTGTLRLTAAGADGAELALSQLRLSLDGGRGVLSAYAARPGATERLPLAEVHPGGTAPLVRGAGATWSGLRLTLTGQGAALLSDWSGERYEKGGELAPLDVTVGLAGQGTGDQGDGAGTPAGEPSGPPSPSPEAPPRGDTSSAPAQTRTADEPAAPPTAVLAHPAVAAGGEQLVTGAGFSPGEVVLVAIDDDTRYDVVADDEGRVSQAFPVYRTATPGAHAVELRPVSGTGAAPAAGFTVTGADEATGAGSP